jgi:hypothetical protein
LSIDSGFNQAWCEEKRHIFYSLQGLHQAIAQIPYWPIFRSETGPPALLNFCCPLVCDDMGVPLACPARFVRSRR